MISCARQDSSQDLPLVVWFAGLGDTGGFACLTPALLAPHTSAPFVMAAPRRDNRKWWFISDAGEWGWLDGSFDRIETETVADWINHMANLPGIDRNRISIIGFSAGAYAATEILACSRVRLHCLFVGGVHGHGQPDLEGVQGKKRLKGGEAIMAKWNAYLSRLKSHGGVAHEIGFFHSRTDTLCPIRYAEEIAAAVQDRQVELGMPSPWLDEEVQMDSKKT